jgi:peptidoglycan/LPS O-acetylase OafA/YrhL
VGDASYSLYLIHPLVLSALSQVWRKAGLGGTTAGMAAFCLVAIAVSTLAGLACHRLVERPLGQRLTRRRLPAVRATTG